MSIIGTPGSEDRKKFIAGLCFALIAIAVLYFELRDPGAPATSPHQATVVTVPPASSGSQAGSSTPTSNAVGNPLGPAAKVIGTTSAALDPTLHMEAMLVTESVPYEGTGRNIFSAVSAPIPVAIPTPVKSARIVTPPPPPVVRTCPPDCPPPPPIPLKFCGFFSSPDGDHKQAILVNGEDMVLAYPGDIVLRRYRVISIAANSIQVEDMQNNNKQTLPLLAN